ncbi:BamA/TamA family outer membrane protein [Anaeromyxobacter paludicola]|uniref:Bacterial surface antigen (D15) domain-containing protein n=1 Tax=Anaeromyxobacter paludicola TaxID=2918171 RepID=A0ABM7XG53_9BACT|nr:BamA/TamA family outer membrane protein [Anaeromyxobacter paludicola]BDG10871.1 hypothetical protein AMPC_39840 [Anaeromyxobacter paludicola]
MSTALLLGLLAASAPRFEAAELDGWHFAALPVVSYGSDVGFMAGAALLFYRPLTAAGEERDEVSLSGSYATRGPRALDAGWSVRRILDSSLHAYLNLHLADDDLMPYWGEGAGLGGLDVPVGAGSPPEPFRYHDRRVFAAATVGSLFLGPLGWHARARFLGVDVAGRGSLLSSSLPPGSHGGKVALGEVGLTLDTRDREMGARRGLYLAAAAFAVPPVSGLSDFSFHGLDATARAWIPVLPFATLALRAVYDVKRSDDRVGGATAAVPFFERMLYEGPTYDEGLGGASTLRGVARYRISGDEKALGNAELRIRLLTTRLAGKTQELGLAAGVDAGWARQPGYAPVHAESAAAGVRLIWDRAIVLRVEAAHARGGETGVYVAFGELF